MRMLLGRNYTIVCIGMLAAACGGGGSGGSGPVTQPPPPFLGRRGQYDAQQ